MINIIYTISLFKEVIYLNTLADFFLIKKYIKFYIKKYIKIIITNIWHYPPK